MYALALFVAAILSGARGADASVDFPPGARWEPIRVKWFTLTNYIDHEGSYADPPTASPYTANHTADPPEPNDHPYFALAKKFDEEIMPLVAAKYEREFMVVRTRRVDEHPNPITIKKRTCYSHWAPWMWNDFNVTDVDLLIITTFSNFGGRGGGGACGTDEFGRVTVARQTLNAYVLADMEDPDAAAERAFSGILDVTWHEVHHGLEISRTWPSSPFIYNTIAQPPSYWPAARKITSYEEPSFLPHVYDQYAKDPVAKAAMDEMWGNPPEYDDVYSVNWLLNSPRILEHVRHFTGCPTAAGYPARCSNDIRPWRCNHQANMKGEWGDVNSYGAALFISAMTYAFYEDTGLWKPRWDVIEFENQNAIAAPNQTETGWYYLKWLKRGCGFFDDADSAWFYNMTDEAMTETDDGRRFYAPLDGASGVFCNGAANAGLGSTHCLSTHVDRKTSCGGHYAWQESVMPQETKIFHRERRPGTKCVDLDSSDAFFATHGEDNSSDARCFRGTLEPDGSDPWSHAGFENAFCFKHRCDANNLIEFEINGVWYECPELGGAVAVDGFTGHVTCPHQMILCPANCPMTNGVECAGRGTCNRKTGICYCTELDVNSSWVGIGCDIPYTQFWPDSYSSGSAFFRTTKITIGGAALLATFDVGDEETIKQSVIAALGIEADPDSVTIADYRFKFGATIEMTEEISDATYDEWFTPSSERGSEGITPFARMLAEDLGGLDARYIEVSVTRESRRLFNRRRRTLASGVAVDYVATVVSDWGVEIAQTAASKSAAGAFPSITVGAPVVTSQDELAVVVDVHFATDDAEAYESVSARMDDEDALNSNLTVGLEADFRANGIAGRKKKKAFPVAVVAGSAAGGFVFLVVVAVVLVKAKGKGKGKVATEAKSARGAKRPAVKATEIGKRPGWSNDTARNKVAPV